MDYDRFTRVSCEALVTLEWLDVDRFLQFMVASDGAYASRM